MAARNAFNPQNLLACRPFQRFNLSSASPPLPSLAHTMALCTHHLMNGATRCTKPFAVGKGRSSPNAARSCQANVSALLVWRWSPMTPRGCQPPTRPVSNLRRLEPHIGASSTMERATKTQGLNA